MPTSKTKPTVVVVGFSLRLETEEEVLRLRELVKYREPLGIDRMYELQTDRDKMRNVFLDAAATMHAKKLFEDAIRASGKRKTKSRDNIYPFHPDPKDSIPPPEPERVERDFWADWPGKVVDFLGFSK